MHKAIANSKREKFGIKGRTSINSAVFRYLRALSPLISHTHQRQARTGSVESNRLRSCPGTKLRVQSPFASASRASLPAPAPPAPTCAQSLSTEWFGATVQGGNDTSLLAVRAVAHSCSALSWASCNCRCAICNLLWASRTASSPSVAAASICAPTVTAVSKWHAHGPPPLWQCSIPRAVHLRVAASVNTSEP